MYPNPPQTINLTLKYVFFIISKCNRKTDRVHPELAHELKKNLSRSKTGNKTEFPKSIHVDFTPKSKKLQNMIYI